MADAEPRVRSGQIVALRLFDLKRAEQLSASRAQGASARSRLAGTPAKALCLGVPPLALDLVPGPARDRRHRPQAAASLRRSSLRRYGFGLAIGPPVEAPAVGASIQAGLLHQTRRLLGVSLDRSGAAPSQEDDLLACRLHAVVAEVSELTERVDNALQVTEDVDLARIHVAAMELPACPT